GPGHPKRVAQAASRPPSMRPLKSSPSVDFPPLGFSCLLSTDRLRPEPIVRFPGSPPVSRGTERHATFAALATHSDLLIHPPGLCRSLTSSVAGGFGGGRPRSGRHNLLSVLINSIDQSPLTAYAFRRSKPV